MKKKPAAPTTVEQRKKMCTGKRLYTMERAATAAAARSARSYRKPFRIYACPNCSWWHVTSKPKDSQ